MRIKITVICLITSLFLVSCGQKPEKKESVTIQLAFYSEVRNAALAEAIVKEFQKRNPSIHVKIIPMHGDYTSKILTMIAGAIPPDIMVFLPPFMIRLADKGILLNLDTYMANDKEFQGFKDDIHPASLDAGRFKDHFHAVPFWTNSMVLFYNKTIFDKEKLKYPDETWDLDQLLLGAKVLTKDIDNDGRVDQYGFFDYVYNMETFAGLYPYIRKNGKILFNEDMSRCLIDTPEVLETIRWCFELITKYKVIPSPFMGDERLAEYEQSFMSGKVAMLVSGWWSVQRFQTIKNFEWSVAPIPKGKVDYKPCAAMFLGAYSKTKYPKECWEFLKFLLTEEAQRILCEKQLGIPVRFSVANSSYFLNQYSRSEENKIFLGSLKGAKEYPHHFIGEMEWLGNANVKLQLVLLGKKSLEEACKEIAEEYHSRFYKKN